MRIERPDGVDLVTEKVNADGELGAGREEIENAAPARDLARFEHEWSRFEPMLSGPLKKLVLGHTVARPKHASRCTERIRWHDDLQETMGGSNENRAGFCALRSRKIDPEARHVRSRFPDQTGVARTGALPALATM